MIRATRRPSATERAEHAVAIERVKEGAVSEVEAVDGGGTPRRSATVVIRLIQLTVASLILAACTSSMDRGTGLHQPSL